MSNVILSNKTLTNLDLSVNFIADTGIAKLSAALERNKSIKTIGLDMCGITNDEFSKLLDVLECCLLYTSPSPRDLSTSRMPSSA